MKTSRAARVWTGDPNGRRQGQTRGKPSRRPSNIILDGYVNTTGSGARSRIVETHISKGSSPSRRTSISYSARPTRPQSVIKDSNEVAATSLAIPNEVFENYPVSPLALIFFIGLFAESLLPWVMIWLSDTFSFDLPPWSRWPLFAGPPVLCLLGMLIHRLVRHRAVASSP
jgi:hypothetical protein